MTEQGTETATVESIDGQIADIRANPGYAGSSNRGTSLEQRNFNRQLNGLYEQREKLQGGNAAAKEEPEVSGNKQEPRGRSRLSDGGHEANDNKSQDLQAQAKAEFSKLAEMGHDMSEESTDGMTQERLDGIQTMRMIEEGDLDGVRQSIQESARQAGMSNESTKAMSKFFAASETAIPKDLKLALSQTVADWIYNMRTQGA